MLPLPIAGEWLTTETSDTIRLPWDSSPVAEVARATPALLVQAIARTHFPQSTNTERADLLTRIATLLRRDHALFAQTITKETGKPITEARTEVDRGLLTLQAASIAARELKGEVVPIDNRFAMTIREPLGVIGIITPFNFPLNLTLHKLAPALAAGNAVVHKPSEQTPLSALQLARIVQEAGAPTAYSVVTGPGETIGAALVESPAIAMITFTGSVPTGRAIRARAGLKKVTLELGGNCAVIVDRDADLSLAATRIVQGGYAYSGQTCISVQRVYAHSDIATELRDRLIAAVAALRIGHPLEDSTQVASLITTEAADRVEQWTRESGGKLLTGGERTGVATITPGILADVPEDSRFMKEELFGPVIALNTYDDLDAAIANVNSTRFGLQSGIFTRDLERAFHAAQSIQAGAVLINDVPTFRADHMPYGGVKDSGIGREGPRYAIEEMTESKLVIWR